MTLEETLYTALGPLVGTRAYPDAAPADTARPYVVFSDVSNSATYTLRRAGGTDRRRVQVDLYTDSNRPLAEHSSLALVVRRSVEGLGGQMQDESRMREPEQSLRRQRMDFYIWHQPGL